VKDKERDIFFKKKQQRCHVNEQIVIMWTAARLHCLNSFLRARAS